MRSGYLNRLCHHWEKFWFPESTGVHLAVCRIVIVAAQLLFFFPSLESQLRYLQPFRGFIDAQLLIVALSQGVPNELFPTVEAFRLIYWTTVLAGAATLIGLFTRTSAFLFAFGNWIMVAHDFSYGEDHHPEAILCIFLLLLALSPSGKRLSLDALMHRSRLQLGNEHVAISSEKVVTAAWPIKLTQILLCFAYVSTGLAKLVYGGLAWMNGYTLQQIIFSSAISRDIPLGVWLAQQHVACLFLSIGVILFEVFFFLSLIMPRTLPFFLVGGVMLHLGIYLFEGSDFFQYIVLYIVFLDVEKWFHRAGAIVQSYFWGRETERSQAKADI